MYTDKDCTNAAHDHHEMVGHFHQFTPDGPRYVCSCCEATLSIEAGMRLVHGIG